MAADLTTAPFERATGLCLRQEMVRSIAMNVDVRPPKPHLPSRTEAARSERWQKADAREVKKLLQEAVFGSLAMDNMGRSFRREGGWEVLRRGPSRHLETRIFSIRHRYDDGAFTLEHVATDDNVADILTKTLPIRKFRKFASKILGHDFIKRFNTEGYISYDNAS